VTAPIVSLKADGGQLIQPGRWTVVRFPTDEESYDPLDMHARLQKHDAYEVRDWARDDRSGLIWPARNGWGTLNAMLQWEPGGYDELRDQFIRDPLNLSTGPDTTATDHRPPSPGMQCFTKTWSLSVRVGTPLALRVAHNDDQPRLLTLAELKLEIREGP